VTRLEKLRRKMGWYGPFLTLSQAAAPVPEDPHEAFLKLQREARARMAAKDAERAKASKREWR